MSIFMMLIYIVIAILLLVLAYQYIRKVLKERKDSKNEQLLLNQLNAAHR